MRGALREGRGVRGALRKGREVRGALRKRKTEGLMYSVSFNNCPRSGTESQVKDVLEQSPR